LSSKENIPVTELSSARLNEDAASAAAPSAPDAARKPFVEPAVSVPLDVLEATAFFQASASPETAGSI
jgi:hypothetical protein